MGPTEIIGGGFLLFLIGIIAIILIFVIAYRTGIIRKEIITMQKKLDQLLPNSKQNDSGKSKKTEGQEG